MPTSGQRKLAAIMFTDIVGYSSVMQEDEARGRLVRDRHRSVFEQCTARHNGRIIQYYGDGTLSVFDSAVAAVECAVSMQQQLRTYPQVPLRIGVHLGDIHFDDTEVYGHGVNIAARIEPLCNPGGIFISQKIYDEIQGHPWLKARSIGAFHLKNIQRDIELFAIDDKDVTFPTQADVMRAQTLIKSKSSAEAAERSEAIRRFEREKRRRTYTRLGNWAAILLVVILAGVALSKWMSAGASGPDDGRTAIAVLPFVNMSTSEENEYFSDGMTEDILTLLSRIEGLSVTSRTSVMRYKNTNKTTKQIARELGVDKILEGSVRRDGDAVKITAQLIDATNDSHIWANTYDAQLTNIFSVQTQVAEDIAHELKKTLADNDRTLFARNSEYDVIAYDLYLKGRQLYRKYNREDNDRAIAYFKGALEIEPNFPFALAGLGDAYAQKSFHHDFDAAMLDTAVLMSARAIESDPELSDGYKALGLAYQYQGEVDKALVQYKKALELDPYNDMASSNLGGIYMDRGDMGEAARWVGQTYEINKGVPGAAKAMAELYLSVDEVDKAEEIIDKSIEVNPDVPELYFMKGIIQLHQDEPDGTIASAEKVLELSPGNYMGLELLASAQLYQGQWTEAASSFQNAINAMGKKGNPLTYEAQRRYALSRARGEHVKDAEWSDITQAVDSLKAEHEKYKKMTSILEAGIAAEMGNLEAAFQNLEHALEYHSSDLSVVRVHPIFEPLRNDQRYGEVMRKFTLLNDSLQIEIQKSLSRQSGT